MKNNISETQLTAGVLKWDANTWNINMHTFSISIVPFTIYVFGSGFRVLAPVNTDCKVQLLPQEQV